MPAVDGIETAPVGADALIGHHRTCLPVRTT
jgi:hypothetical protein